MQQIRAVEQGNRAGKRADCRRSFENIARRGEQNQRQPVNAEQIQMIQMRKAIRQKSEHRSGQKCCKRALAEVIRQDVHAVRREQKREEQQRIERQDRVLRDQLNRQAEDADAEHVIVKRKRVDIRIKDIGVKIPGKRRGQLMRRPLRHPDLQQRIAGGRVEQMRGKMGNDGEKHDAGHHPV